MRPSADIEIDETSVAGMLAEQHQDLSDRSLSRVDSGWDNAMFRLGDDLAVRLPRRSSAADLLLNEQRWLPQLAPRLGVPVPELVRVGRPTATYPWWWSVVSWLPGVTAAEKPLSAAEAPRLANSLRNLHVAAPSDAPRNDLRGVPLRTRSAPLHERLARIRHLDEHAVDTLRHMWSEGVVAEGPRRRVWIHGDLHPRNVLSEDGRLAGIIDWGDLTAGDRATDLACAWMLFDGDGRRSFWRAYGLQTDTVLRARAWAVFFGVTLSTSGDERHEEVGRITLRRLLFSRAPVPSRLDAAGPG